MQSLRNYMRFLQEVSMKKLSAIVCAAILTLPLSTLASDNKCSSFAQCTRVTIPITVSETVENDHASLQLSVTETGKQLTSVTENATVLYNKGLAQLKKLSDTAFKAKTNGPHTQTHWEKKKAGDASAPKITGYTVTYRLTLSEIPAGDAAKVLAVASKHFAIDNLTFEASPQKQQHVTNSLLTRAIEEAQSRARLIAKSISKADSKISYPTIDLHTSGPFRVHSQRNLKSAVLLSADAMAAPELEAGESETSVSVTVVAEIEN